MRKHGMIAVVAAVALVVIVADQAFAQTGRARQAGVVYDENGDPMAGALVKFDRERTTSSVDHQEVVTGADGTFGWGGLNGGNWTLTVTKEGYEPFVRRVTISSFEFNQPIEARMVPAQPTGGTAEDAQAAIAEAARLAEAGDYDGAIAKYEEFLTENIEAQPELISIRLLIGEVYEQKEDYDSAIAQYQLILDADPEDANALMKMGNAYIFKGDYAKAEEYYNVLVELKSNDPLVMYNMGEMMLNNGNWEGAVQYYKAAVELQDDFPDAHMKLGYAYFGTEQWQNAITHFEKFLELAPDRPEAEYIQSDIAQCRAYLGQQ